MKLVLDAHRYSSSRRLERIHLWVPLLARPAVLFEPTLLGKPAVAPKDTIPIHLIPTAKREDFWESL